MPDQNYDRSLLKNGAYGFLGMFGLFTAGTVAAIADGFNEMSTGVSNSADLLSRATDTLMIAGIMTGVFTAAVGTIYYNRRDRQNNGPDGP